MTSSTKSPLLDRWLLKLGERIILTQFEGVYPAELPLGAMGVSSAKGEGEPTSASGTKEVFRIEYQALDFHH